MQELVEKLNMELLSVREKAVKSPMTIRELILCACDIAVKESELSKYRAMELEVQNGK
mgnify:CR=1 FL=1